MAGEPILASGSSATNGFWGSVSAGLGAGVGKVISDVLPSWVSGQLGADPVGDVSNPLAKTNLGDLTAGQSVSRFMDNSDVTFESPNAKTILAIGGVLVGLIILMKVL